MKKTLITIAAFAMASVASAESYTLSTLEGTATGANAELHGWAQKLDSAHLTDVELPDVVNLDSVSVLTANPNDQNTSYSGSIKLAVYTSSEMSADTFLGISTNTVVCDEDTPWTTLTTYTFNFEGVTLDTSTSYTYRYVTATSDEESQESSYFRVAMSTADRIDGEAFYVKNGTQSWEPDYSPYATYTVSTIAAAAIPEPTTATLSLLALAGLAARRRRK